MFTLQLIYLRAFGVAVLYFMTQHCIKYTGEILSLSILQSMLQLIYQCRIQGVVIELNFF